MKEHIEGNQEETGDQGKEDGDQATPVGTTVPEEESKVEKQKFDEDGETSENDSNGEERAEGSGQIATTQKNKKEPVEMSIWVWEAVLKFITRIEMADRVSLACHFLKKLCWPRLHGRKVTPHMVEELSFGKEEDEAGLWKLYLWKESAKKIPLAIDSPPPDYIQGFKRINILSLDSEVLKFMRNISSRLNNLCLLVWRHNFSGALDLLPNLLNALNGCTISCLHFSHFLTVSISELRHRCPGLLENIPAISVNPHHTEELNELILAKLEGGKPFVLYFEINSSVPLPFGDIQKAFQTAKKRQSFFIALYNFTWTLQPFQPQLFQLANEETGEVLAFERHGNLKYELYRCPSGEVQQWREEANKLLKDENYTTRIMYR